MTPETIRTLLAGITAGEWVVRNEAYGYADVTSRESNPPGVVNRVRTVDAAFIAAAPGIARYALELAAGAEAARATYAAERQADSERILELAAENERLTTVLDELWEYLRLNDWDRAMGLVRRTLAPQPAPTDGAG